MEARIPLLAAVANGPAGRLPAEQAGLEVSRPGVLITAFAKNASGPETLLRVWEQAGVSGKLTITLPKRFVKATPVNLRGEKIGAPLTIREGEISFDLPGYAPASLSLQPE